MKRAAWFIFAVGLATLGLNTTVNAQVPVVTEIAVPGYPRIPPGLEESGEVQVEISITPAGDVLAAKALSGPPRLRGAAVTAARKWRFRPQEKPTEKWVVTFDFIYRAGIGDPPDVSSIFKPPSRVEIFALARQTVTIEDPPMGVVKKRGKRLQ